MKLKKLPRAQSQSTLNQTLNSFGVGEFSEFLYLEGFAAGACYLRDEGLAVQVMRSDSDEAWPAVTKDFLHYTLSEQTLPTHGWAFLRQDLKELTSWPKNCVFYVPEHSVDSVSLVFVLLPIAAKEITQGHLDGTLEAAANRIQGWYRLHSSRQFLSEEGVKGHLGKVELELRALLDHELRTPMASLLGFAALLEDAPGTDSLGKYQDALKVILNEAERANEAIDRLSLSFYTHSSTPFGAMTEWFDAVAMTAEICAQAESRSVELAGEKDASKLKIQLHTTALDKVMLRGNPSSYRQAILEVLKNAVTYSQSLSINVRIHVMGECLIVDIEDDGAGVTNGTEELIFLRFFQSHPGQGHLRGKRGLGLGLFLARHIAESHGGKLIFQRLRSLSVFRFIWPLAGDESSSP